MNLKFKNENLKMYAEWVNSEQNPQKILEILNILFESILSDNGIEVQDDRYIITESIGIIREMVIQDKKTTVKKIKIIAHRLAKNLLWNGYAVQYPGNMEDWEIDIAAKKVEETWSHIPRPKIYTYIQAETKKFLFFIEKANNLKELKNLIKSKYKIKPIFSTPEMV